jgi:hypothetical protein
MGFIVQLANVQDELARAAVLVVVDREEVFLAPCLEILFKKYAI